MAARIPRCISSARLGSRNAARYFQTSSVAQAQTSSQPLYPSVISLLHEKGIPDSEVPKIPTSGPKGRLLKGDVLAYIGAISAEHPSNLSAQISKLQHLDLSNIKLAAPPPPPPEPTPAQPEPAVEAQVPEPTETSVTLPISLSSVLELQSRISEKLGVTVPLSTFLARATDLANDDLPLSAKARSKSTSADAIFDELVGAEKPYQPETSRGDFVVSISSPEDDILPPAQKTTQEADIIDILTGKASSHTPAAAQDSSSSLIDDESLSDDLATNIFSVSVPVEDEVRAHMFLERMRTLLQDEPGSLIF